LTFLKSATRDWLECPASLLEDVLMAIKDILLPLIGVPSPTAVAVIEKCVRIAASFEAEITALAVEEDVPVRSQVVISADLDHADQVKSTTDAHGLLKAFDASVAEIGVRNVHRFAHLMAGDAPGHLALCARPKDLSIVPVKPHDGRSEKIIEGLIFRSGRPILLCSEELAAGLPVNFERIVIAWDHSAPAARAVGDVLSMLRGARDVQVITATDENTLAEQQSGAELVRHLAKHGVQASFETVRIDGSSVGKVFEALVRDRAADLLVMGAYGHSRLNEWVWGGMTKTVIGRPPCWVILSR
jgi:nucleotide-binding universal stress UspA family protein